MPRSHELIIEKPQPEDQYPRVVHSIYNAIEQEFPGVISIGEVDRRFRELGGESRIQDLRDGQETEIPYPQDQ